MLADSDLNFHKKLMRFEYSWLYFHNSKFSHEICKNLVRENFRLNSSAYNAGMKSVTVLGCTSHYYNFSIGLHALLKLWFQILQQTTYMYYYILHGGYKFQTWITGMSFTITEKNPNCWLRRLSDYCWFYFLCLLFTLFSFTFMYFSWP